MVGGWEPFSNQHFSNSRPDQEEQEGQQRQVQGPMPEAPLHPGAQGLRQGREAQAVSPS